MKITYIELNGFKRFALNSIDKFTMTMQEALQVIIGTNGSGKSSLLNQLTVFPPSAADFRKGGYKEIHVEHNHSNYVLKSSFAQGQKHYFEKDGEVLNDWGITSVQKELVKEHFGIDASVLALTHSKERFSTMSPSKRKEWLLRLCDTNYDYAISVFNRAKEKHRDVVGALKLAKKKLAVETEKILKREEVDLLNKQASELHRVLEILMEYRMPVEKDSHYYDEKLLSQREQLARLASRIESACSKISGFQRTTRAQLTNAISALDAEYKSCQVLVKNYGNQHDQLVEKVTIIQRANNKSAETVELELHAVNVELRKISQNLLHEEENFNVDAATSTFDNVRSVLSDAFLSLPENTDKRYSSTELTKVREKLALYKARLIQMSEKIATWQANVNHLDNHRNNPDTQCPNCEHKFSLNFDPKHYATLKANIQDTLEKVEKEYKPEIASMEKYVEECTEYAQVYRTIVSTFNATPVLSVYWDMFHEQNILVAFPHKAATLLNQIDADLKLQKQYEILLKRAKEIKDMATSLRNVGVTDIQQLNASLNDVRDKLEVYTSKAIRIQQRKTDYSNILQIKTTVDDTLSMMDNLLSNNKQTLDDAIETHRRTIYNDMVRMVQSTLASKEHVIVQMRIQQEIISSVEKQIAELEDEEQAYGSLVKALSPTDGLIANGLYGFINSFVGQMNSVVSRIWEYDLTIEPCALDGETVDLDYKFPVRVNGNSDTVPDVADLSKGQIEAVDLAWLVTSIKYLGLGGLPLILDEIGNAFDATHKETLIHFLKILLEQHVFEQIFLVSHDYALYSSMSAQICVLSAANTVVPVNFNEHVTIG